MKKVLFASMLALVCAVLVSCSKGSNDTPSAAADKALALTQKGDFDGLVDMMYFGQKDEKAEKETKDAMKALIKEKGQKEKDNMVSYKITEESIAEDGKTATVKYKVKYKDQEEEQEKDMKMVKTDKGWMLDSGK